MFYVLRRIICVYLFGLLLKASMQKKLTITLDKRVYEGLHKVVGRRRISRFVESLVRPHVICKDLKAAYRRMAQAEALEWAEASTADLDLESRCRRP